MVFGNVHDVHRAALDLVEQPGRPRTEEVAEQVTQGFANAQLNAFRASIGWYFWQLKMDPDSPLSEYHNGTRIGPSPQWDFTKAVDGVPNEGSSYVFPNLRRYMHTAPDAKRVDEYSRQQFGRVVAARRPKAATVHGFDAGRRAAARADLGRRRMGGPRALGRGA